VQDAGGIFVLVSEGVIVMLGVDEMSPVVGVNVGKKVGVAVSGTGEGNILLVAVGTACGENSTSDMDNAPIVNTNEIKATTSALVRPRILCIISFL
jgi:hypothetical protein